MNPPTRPGRLAGRKALITGASRGIGRAIALRYAEEGADLFLTATNLALLEETGALARAQGAQVWLHRADVSEPAEVQAMVDTAAQALGTIDILVNNAGVYKAARLVDTTAEDFDRVMKVNVYGAFHVMQAVLRRMQAQKHGKVVNIASSAGKWGSMNQSAYNASKHAVVGLTRCAALEMGPLGVHVNAICPGFVQTDMVDELKRDQAARGVADPDAVLAGLVAARVPLGRVLVPEEIAGLAVYLGSRESGGMTGQSILVDGSMLMI